MAVGSLIGDHPLAAPIVLAAVVVLIAMLVFMTHGLRKLERQEPEQDTESAEAKRIRRESRKWWMFFHPGGY